MKLFSRYTLYLLSLGLLGSVYSAQVSAGDFYGSAGIQQSKVRISDSTFDLIGPTGRVGKWIGQGIGLEIGATLPATDDQKNEVTIEVDRLLSAGIRLESPSARNRPTAAYVLGGIANAQISGIATGNERSSRSYSGAFIGLGLLHAIGKKSYLTLDFTYYKVDQSINIPSIHLGFRHSF